MFFTTNKHTQKHNKQTTRISRMSNNTNLVKICKVEIGREQSEGVGARVIRTVGSSVDYWDPFLLFDEAKISLDAGFPQHPHRGFQTVSYMIEGAMKHKDSKGNSGVIKAGEVQWMTAGRGIVHSEMPVKNNTHGIQLWVNLPKASKMIEPSYQDLTKKNMVKKQVTENCKVTVIAGKSTTTGLESILKLQQDLLYLDVVLTKPGESYSDMIPATHQGFMYVLSGTGKLAGTKSGQLFKHKHCLFFKASTNGRDQEFIWEAEEASPENPFRVLIISGEPLNEPMARHGPFVMNTDAEIKQAYMDYHAGKL